MPIIAGVSFGITIPYNSVKQTRRAYSAVAAPRPTTPGRLSSLSDFAAKAAYKYNRASRLINQYKLYNKRVDTPTIGTIINMEF